MFEIEPVIEEEDQDQQQLLERLARTFLKVARVVAESSGDGVGVVVGEVVEVEDGLRVMAIEKVEV